MKKVALVLLISLLATALSLSTFARAAHAQEAASPEQAGSDAGGEQKATTPAPEPKGHHRPRGVIGGTTTTCGCQAVCEKGWFADKVTNCHDENGRCKDESKDDSCTLTCTKKGEAPKQVTGKCVKVQT